MDNLRSGFRLELDDEDRKLAQEELGEDPKQTSVRIQSLRAAIQQMKHLIFPTDDDVLLLFLRRAKFSQARALQHIDNFVRNRTTAPNKQLYVADGTTDALVLQLFKDGVCCVLPTLPESGIRTIIFRGGLLSDDITVRQAFRALIATLDALLLVDPICQIRGVQYLIDNHKATTHYWAQWMNVTTIKMLIAAFVNVLPCRMKGLHAYRSGTFINALFAMGKFLLSAKLYSRTFIHGSQEALHAAIPPEILPDELGGKAGSYEELCTKTYDFAVAYQPLWTKYASCAYDESQKVEGSVPTESFTKLDLD